MSLDWSSWGGFALALGVAALIELALIVVSHIAGRILRRRYPSFAQPYARPRRELLAFTASVLLLISVLTSWPHDPSRTILRHALILLVIATAAWFISGVITATIERIREQHPIAGDADQETRRLHTQLSLIKAFANAAVWLVAIGFGFFTIPGAEALGTSILASAGLASVVAGIAAQSLLGNVFAGLQLAFSGSIRVGDLVVATGQTGRVEEVTLTSVVVKLWDGRRLVLPTAYFTTTPFENWTHGTDNLLGAVHFDVDWRVSPAAMREKLDDVLGQSELWDKRSSGLIVEDATGGSVRVRALVSAADSEKLFDLRCLVREELVEWIASQSQQALPVQRTLLEGDGAAGSGRP